MYARYASAPRSVRRQATVLVNKNWMGYMNTLNTRQELEMLLAFRNSNSEYRRMLLALTKECALKSGDPSHSVLPGCDLGADLQAISINVLPSSVASL